MDIKTQNDWDRFRNHVVTNGITFEALLTLADRIATHREIMGKPVIPSKAFEICLNVICSE